MEFKPNAAAIDTIGQSFSIEHAHLILVLEAIDLGARHTLRHCLVPYVHRVIYPRDRLGCVELGERIAVKALENNNLD